MKQKDELLQISLIEAEKMNLGTVLHTSEERGSLVNTWAEKERSENRNEHCNRKVHGQTGKHEKILSRYDHSLEYIEAKPDNTLRQEIMHGDSTSIQNTSVNNLTTKIDSMRSTKSDNPITDK